MCSPLKSSLVARIQNKVATPFYGRGHVRVRTVAHHWNVHSLTFFPPSFLVVADLPLSPYYGSDFEWLVKCVASFEFRFMNKHQITCQSPYCKCKRLRTPSKPNDITSCSCRCSQSNTTSSTSAIVMELTSVESPIFFVGIHTDMCQSIIWSAMTELHKMHLGNSVHVHYTMHFVSRPFPNQNLFNYGTTFSTVLV